MARDSPNQRHLQNSFLTKIKLLRELILAARAPDVVYIAEGNWPLDLALQIEADAFTSGIKDKEKAMEEAELEAEKIIRKKLHIIFRQRKQKKRIKKRSDYW